MRPWAGDDPRSLVGWLSLREPQGAGAVGEEDKRLPKEPTGDGGPEGYPSSCREITGATLTWVSARVKKRVALCHCRCRARLVPHTVLAAEDALHNPNHRLIVRRIE